MLKTISPGQLVEPPILPEDAVAELRLQGLAGLEILPLKIAAALATVEQHCGRVFSPRIFEVDYRAGDLPRRLPMSFGDFAVVNATVEVEGAQEEFEPDIVESDCGGQVLGRVFGVDERAKVVLRYSVDADLPPDVRAAVLLLVGHLFENREATVVGVASTIIALGVDYLLEPHRVSLGA